MLDCGSQTLADRHGIVTRMQSSSSAGLKTLAVARTPDSSQVRIARHAARGRGLSTMRCCACFPGCVVSLARLTRCRACSRLRRAQGGERSGVYRENHREQLRREPALACSCGLLRWVVQLMDSIYQQLIEMGKLGFHYPRGMELVPRRLMIRVASVPWPGRHEMPTSPPATRAYRRAIGNPTPYPENLAPKFLL